MTEKKVIFLKYHTVTTWKKHQGKFPGLQLRWKPASR